MAAGKWYVREVKVSYRPLVAQMCNGDISARSRRYLGEISTHRPLVAQVCDGVVMGGVEECVHVEIDGIVAKRVSERHREIL